MKNNLLVIYNTCGLSREPDESRWLSEIELLLSQSLPGVRLVHSDCGSSEEKRKVVFEKFGDKISYYHTKEDLPIQHTCNHAVKKMIESYGEYDAYCYVGAGISFNNVHQLAYAFRLLKEEPDIAKVDFHIIRHPNIKERLEEMHPPFDFYHFINEDKTRKYYVMKPGQRVNNHCTMFSNEYCRSYDYRLLPDSYAGNGAEGVYSYLTSCINKKHVVMSYNYCPSLYHIPDMDGANQFLLKEGKERTYFYDWSFKGLTDFDKLNEDGLAYGFCTDTHKFEPCARQNPRPEFDEFGLPKSKQQQQSLYEMIKNNIFLTKEKFDYSKITNEFRQ